MRKKKKNTCRFNICRTNVSVMAFVVAIHTWFSPDCWSEKQQRTSWTNWRRKQMKKRTKRGESEENPWDKKETGQKNRVRNTNSLWLLVLQVPRKQQLESQNTHCLCSVLRHHFSHCRYKRHTNCLHGNDNWKNTTNVECVWNTTKPDEPEGKQSIWSFNLWADQQQCSEP